MSRPEVREVGRDLVPHPSGTAVMGIPALTLCWPIGWRLPFWGAHFAGASCPGVALLGSLACAQPLLPKVPLLGWDSLASGMRGRLDPKQCSPGTRQWH